MSFGFELKRRKVLRVAVAYFFTSVAVLEAANLVLPSLFLPAWVFDTVVTVVLVGFPVALVLAWTFEFVDGRVRRERPPDANETPGSGPVQRAAVPILIGCIVLLAWRPWSGSDPLAALAGSGLADSVAVVPVDNRTGDPANDHVAAAITEGIVRHLRAAGDVKVSDPYSVASMVDAGVSTQDMMRELGVQKLVRGSLFLEGETLLLSALIIDGFTGQVLWDGTYPGGEASGYEAASMIAGEFGLAYESQTPELRQAYTSPVLMGHTGHEALIEGTRWLGRRTFEGITRARELFGIAVESDPEDAEALAALSKAHALSLIYRYRGGPEGYEAAGMSLALANRAVAADPDLSAAYAARGYIASRASGPLGEVGSDCREALDLDPNAVDGLSWCARVLQQLGWETEALDNAEKAIALDPRNAGRRLAVAYNAIAVGDYDEAVEHARSARALSPGLALPPLLEARALLLSGRPQQCLDLDLGPNAGTRAACLHDAGQIARARAIVDSLATTISLQESADSVFTDVARAEDLAVYHAWIGDSEMALTWVEMAFELSPSGVESRTLQSELFDRVRDDDTFRTGLEAIQAGIWERVQLEAERHSR